MVGGRFEPIRAGERRAAAVDPHATCFSCRANPSCLSLTAMPFCDLAGDIPVLRL